MSALRKLATKGFEETLPARPFSANLFSGDVLEVDFWPGTVSGLLDKRDCTANANALLSALRAEREHVD